MIDFSKVGKVIMKKRKEKKPSMHRAAAATV